MRPVAMKAILPAMCPPVTDPDGECPQMADSVRALLRQAEEDERFVRECVARLEFRLQAVWLRALHEDRLNAELRTGTAVRFEFVADLADFLQGAARAC